MNLAEAWGLRTEGTNPCRHVKRYAEKKRERFLSGDELTRLGTVLSEAERTQSVSASTVAAVFLAAGIYQIKCDVHGWMQAFVRVDPHRYHAVSDAAGGFAIEGVPAGSYMLEAWHERLGFLRQRVEIAAGSPTSIRLTYSSLPR